ARRQRVGDMLQQPAEVVVLFEPFQYCRKFACFSLDSRLRMAVAEAASECAAQEIELEQNEFVAQSPLSSLRQFRPCVEILHQLGHRSELQRHVEKSLNE